MSWDHVMIAAKNVQNRRLRSWLTILGIVIGVATIVALLSLSQGLQNAIEAQFQTLGVNDIRVVPANLRGPPTGALGLDKHDANVVASVKGVDYVSSILLEYAQVEFDSETRPITVYAEAPETAVKSFAAQDLELESGRFLQSADSGAILIGNNVAYDTFTRDLRLRNSLLIKDKKFKVVGIFTYTGSDVDNRIYMTEDDARSLFDKPDVVNTITVAIQPGEEIDEVAARVKSRLEKTRSKDDFEVFTPAQLLNQLSTILDVVQAILVAIAAISLFVGAVGIMNSMYTSVLERTRDIGVFKAIGAKNSDIFQLFVVEAGFIGLTGGVIGSLFGFGIAKAIEVGAAIAGFNLLAIRLDPYLLLFALSFAFVIGILSGILPSIRASRLRPVDALRYE